MPITISGDSPNLTSAGLASPAFSGTPTGTGVLTNGTAVATTSGTSIDFTSIPSWVKRITVTAMGVSTNGITDWGVQLGTSGGIVTTGYVGNCSNNGTGTLSPTNIALAVYSEQAATTASGSMVINLANPLTNTWTFSGVSGTTGYSFSSYYGFYVTLPNTLTTVRIATRNGTDTFDAGSINILYE
jgi:hypothetical protein